MNYLSKEQLEKLTTARILAYKKKLMKVVETPDWDQEISTRPNKSCTTWQKALQDVKEVLATREHVV